MSCGVLSLACCLYIFPNSTDGGNWNSVVVVLGCLGPPTITTLKKSFNYGAKTPSVRVHVQKEKGPSSYPSMFCTAFAAQY